MKRLSLFVLLAVCAAFCRMARATSNYTYKKGEYVTIVHGLSPNRQYSLATHGDGEMGYGNFHVYLMREPGHKKIGPLTEIEDDILDTAANAYKSVWSRDSRHVAILYRTDRHFLAMNLYRVERNRAFPVANNLNLIQAAAKRVGTAFTPSFQEHWERINHYEVQWQSSFRFVLRQESFEWGQSPLPAHSMKRFGQVKKGKNIEDGYANDVSVEAVCQLNRTSDAVQIVSLKPGTFTYFDE